MWLHGLQTHWRNTHFLPTNILTHCILRPLPMHMHIHPPEILVDAVQGFALDLRAGAPARPGPVARWDALVQALWGHRGHPLICNMPLVRPHMPGSHVSVLQSALLGKQTADNGDMYDKKSLDAHSFPTSPVCAIMIMPIPCPSAPGLPVWAPPASDSQGERALLRTIDSAVSKRKRRAMSEGHSRRKNATKIHQAQV